MFCCSVLCMLVNFARIKKTRSLNIRNSAKQKTKIAKKKTKKKKTVDSMIVVL